MPTLIAKTDNGNFTDAASWAVAESATGAAQLTATSTSNVGTGYTYSPTFTVTNGNVIEGVLLQISKNGASGTTTFSVALSDDNGVTATREVTINNSDILGSTLGNHRGWVYFKFATPLTGDGGTDYRVGVKSSSSGSMIVWRSGTAADWTRLLKTTTTAAPAAGDNLVIVGENTGGGTGNDITIVFNNTATTDFGFVHVGTRGILTCENSAATAYYFKISGDFEVQTGGTVNFGSSGTPIQSTSSFTLWLDCVSAGDFGLIIKQDGTFNYYGNPKGTQFSKLTANLSAGNTVVTVASTSGWLTGDVLVFPSTVRSASPVAQREYGTILTVDSATQVTLTSGLSFAHAGVSPTQAHIGNLTRNCVLRGGSAASNVNTYIRQAGVMNLDSVEIYSIGTGAAPKRGIELEHTTGNAGTTLINRCSLIHAHNSSSFFWAGTSTGANWTITNNVVVGGTNFPAGLAAVSQTGPWTFTDNLLNGVGSNTCNDTDGTFSRNVICNCSSFGLQLSDNGPNNVLVMEDNESYCNGGVGFQFANVAPVNGVQFSCVRLKSWRNNSYGINLTGVAGITFDNGLVFGNTHGISLSSQGDTADCIFKDFTFCSDTTYTQTAGLWMVSGTFQRIYFESCSFGVVSGIYAAHTYDILCSNTPGVCEIYLTNTILASSTEVSGTSSGFYQNSFISSQKHDQVSGNHKTWKRTGIISIDTTIYDTTPSERLTPNSATSKLESGCHFVAVDSGGAVTPSVKVRKSVVGDGAAYNGNQPRLIVKKNVAAGITVDTVLATATNAANGAWETLSGTSPTVTDDAVLEFIIDCDGTTGWVNVDSFTSPSQPTTGDMKHWRNGLPYSGVVPSGGSAAPIFVLDDE